MGRALSALCVAGAASVFAASGCAAHPAPPVAESAAPTSVASAAPPATPAALPGADALTDVLYRLVDPVIPGADKIALVSGATAADASELEGFAAALRDGGFTPVTVTATDIRWSDAQPGDVLATVTISGPRPDRGEEFRFPMEFSARDGAWQLTQDTAELLLPGP